jgi:hypothetical protein
MRGTALFLGLSVLATTAHAEDIISRHTAGQLLAGGRHIPGLAQFVGSYGADWEVRWDEQRSIPLLFHGRGVPLLPSAANGLSPESAGLSPDRDVTLDDAARVAAEFVERNAELFGIVEGSLVLDRDRSRSTREAARWSIELSARARNGSAAASVFVRIDNGNAVQFGVGSRAGGIAPPISESDPLGLLDAAAAPCEARSAYAVALFYDDDDGDLANGTPNAGRIYDAANARGGACGNRPRVQPAATPTRTPTPRSRTPTATPTPRPPVCRSPSLPIPDGAATGASDALSFASTGLLKELKVSLKIEHARVGDLVVKLTHVESGKSATLLDRPGLPGAARGCRGAGVDATFEDGVGAAGETACNAAPPALAGALRPKNALAVFDGDVDGGTWTLTVIDAVAGDAGRLVTWCLESMLVKAPTPTPTAPPRVPTATPISPTPTPELQPAARRAGATGSGSYPRFGASQRSISATERSVRAA